LRRDSKPSRSPGTRVSGTVRDQIRDKLPYGYKNDGEQRVKNMARPVRAAHPGSDHFVGDVKPTLRKEILDISVTGREAQVKPDSGAE
jgi:hypothetical protein